MVDIFVGAEWGEMGEMGGGGRCLMTDQAVERVAVDKFIQVLSSQECKALSS